MIPISLLEDEIMPWAEEHESAAYASTLGVQGQTRKYRRYMQRLVEIRYEQDPDWDPPLRLLEDTNIRATFKAKDGTAFDVKGRRCEGLRKMSWTLLAILVEQDRPLDSLQVAMDELDLFVADDDREWPRIEIVPQEPEDEEYLRDERRGMSEPEPEPEPEQGDLLR